MKFKDFSRLALNSRPAQELCLSAAEGLQVVHAGLGGTRIQEVWGKEVSRLDSGTSPCRGLNC